MRIQMLNKCAFKCSTNAHSNAQHSNAHSNAFEFINEHASNCNDINHVGCNPDHVVPAGKCRLTDVKSFTLV